jgi:predicted protein tyrosine phosphatase
MPPEFKCEKNWKHLYLRSAKLARAKQLGHEYPALTEGELTLEAGREASERLNVLFVCSRNQWRSPTAESIWRKHPALSVRSAGTSPNARRQITEGDLRWCETIFVMEEKHKSRLQAEFGRLIQHTPMYVLDIPDEYKYLDPDLIAELQQSVAGILGLE